MGPTQDAGEPPGADSIETTHGTSAERRRDAHRRSRALTALLVFAVFYTIYFARGFFLPIVLAIMASFVLRPFVRGLQRARVPEALGAALIVGVLVTGAAAGINALAGPVAEFAKNAPETLREVEAKVRELRKPVEDVNRATEQVEHIARGDGDKERAVVVQRETLASVLGSSMRAFVVQSVIFVFLLYFVLASGQAFLDKASRILPWPGATTRVRELARHIEREASIYLLTVALINGVEGIAIGIMAWWVGLDHPVLWGILAATFNFVPYLGAITCCSIMTLVALAALPLERALLVPLCYGIIGSIEGYLVTPVVLGRRLTLDPLAVFVAVVFWGWLWGVVGAVVAVPILVVGKIACEHVPGAEPIAALIGRAERPRAT